MRELKFRVWDRIEKNFIYFSIFDGLFPECDYQYYKLNLKPINQYIGYKDKTGKEIYEGDIFNNEYYGICIIEYSELFASYMMLLAKDKSLGYPLHHIGRSNIEIIGNIHENKEMLQNLS